MADAIVFPQTFASTREGEDMIPKYRSREQYHLDAAPFQNDESHQLVAWKLRVKEGRQTWDPVEVKTEQEKKKIQTHIDEFWLQKPSNAPDSTYENSKPVFTTPEESSNKAIEFYSKLLTEDGHFAGDYGGPLFLLPGLIIVCYISGILNTISKHFLREFRRYILNMQNADGGWGLHIEGPSTMFGTCLNYIALRLLGIGRDEDKQVILGREWIRKHGGAIGCPQWGKLYMCALNVCDWRGIDSIPPELWLLPSWFPLLQPGKWWCHCRVVYLPMGYVYGRGKQHPLNELTRQIREEIYVQSNYEHIAWDNYKTFVCPTDVYYPYTTVYKLFSSILYVYEKYLLPTIAPLRWLRQWACNVAIDHIRHEDMTTKHIDIGPVNKVLNMLSIYLEEGNQSELFKKHVERIYDYIWMSDTGAKYQGYNGSQLWDTAFAAQAIAINKHTLESSHVKECLNKIKEFVEFTQVKEDVDQNEKYYRHISNGGWPFSTLDHGWPISDCTAEGLKACLVFRSVDYLKNAPLKDERAFDAVNVILSMRNSGSGGWATYELTRTYPIIEQLNPAVLYGDIMIDYPHVECTSACLQALCHFRKYYPNHRSQEVNHAIAEAVKFLKRVQRSDGGWYGCWAVCFCYATWFGVTGLIAAGEDKNSEAIRRACQFLVKNQKEDGGWGESFESSVKKVYVQSRRSQVINTSWSLLALMAAKYEDKTVIERGIQLLMRRQMPNGDFPQEHISGVFNHNCMITYSNYRNIFPIWALGYYLHQYQKQ